MNRCRTRTVGATILLALAVGGCRGGGTGLAGAAGPGSTAAVSTGAGGGPSPTSLLKGEISPGLSLVATARGGTIAVRAAAGGSGRVLARLTNPTATGAPATFLVLNAADPGTDWLQVLLPQRPNGSTGWVRRGDVTLSTSPYRLIVSMSAHRLDVLDGGHRVARYPVGVGKVTTPTPAGTYFLTELIRPPDPHGAYGPYAFGLSAFSSTLQRFAGGPGQLGLHGTDAPNGLGHDVSHGCLRVANTVITQLAHELPLGTPIEIRA
jgi:lipoprotein-anchoring transpeptidase ErfK/SrfK